MAFSAGNAATKGVAFSLESHGMQAGLREHLRMAMVAAMSGSCGNWHGVDILHQPFCTLFTLAFSLPRGLTGLSATQPVPHMFLIGVAARLLVCAKAGC